MKTVTRHRTAVPPLHRADAAQSGLAVRRVLHARSSTWCSSPRCCKTSPASGGSRPAVSSSSSCPGSWPCWPSPAARAPASAPSSSCSRGSSSGSGSPRPAGSPSCSGPSSPGLVMMTVFDAVVVAVGVRASGSTSTGLGLAVLTVLLVAARHHDGRLLDRHGAGHQGDQQLRRHHQRHQPARSCCWPGCSCPSRSGPLWLRVLAHLNPLYYLVVAARVPGRRPPRHPAVWQAFAVLVPLCVLVLAWATRVFRQAVA